MPVALMIVLMVPCVVVGIWALLVLLPLTNKFFSLIWVDPTERQRREIIQRLREHHVDGVIPEETAVLMTAAEFSTTEANLLRAAELFSVADAKAVITGKRSIVGHVAGKIIKQLRTNADAKPKKAGARRKPQEDETPGSVEDSIQSQEGNEL